MKIKPWIYRTTWINRTTLTNSLSTVIAALLIHFNVNAAVSGPDETEQDHFMISWTNTGHSSCLPAYKIYEYKNNQYARTLTRNSPYPKNYLFTNKAVGEYRYVVRYARCNSSGKAYLSAGVHTVTVTDKTQYHTSFIHTDLLGSPVIESQE